ncbi:MAG: DUF924 family protein [Rhizobiales bacterium]|nr:DUF924 family protein [Hyphomicrobiales bacterium]
MTIQANDILDFWFDAGPQKWWVKDQAFDATIAEKFSAIHEIATDGGIDGWMEGADSALALVIILDQFSRNLFRGDARTFAQDEKALALARAAIDAGFDREVGKTRAQFFYLPFMHSEDLAMQDFCVALYRLTGDVSLMHHAVVHRDIICRFRHFPHRNGVLGRLTSPAEQAFLDNGGFGG